MTPLRLLLLLLLAVWAGAAEARTPVRSVAVTIDDLPYQGAAAQLCDPGQAMALTTAFVDMLRPLDTHATVFVNADKVCDARRDVLLPALLSVWLDAGFDMGNHTWSHINIHRSSVEDWLADVDAGAPVLRELLGARGRELRWFRHPFLFTGETEAKKAAMAAGLMERGYVVAPVTIDNNDWMFAAVYRRAEADGDTALMARIGEAYVATWMPCWTISSLTAPS